MNCEFPTGHPQATVSLCFNVLRRKEVSSEARGHSPLLWATQLVFRHTDTATIQVYNCLGVSKVKLSSFPGVSSGLMT